MNTSFPSAASDFASLLAGGKQPNTNAQLKGIFASLACSKPAKTESTGPAKPDFEAMLASPASSENASHGAANPPNDSAGKPAGDVVTRAVAGGWCNLMVEMNDAITTTLQIKGIGRGPDDPLLPEMVAVLPENPVVAQVPTPESETLPVPLTPAPEIAVPTVLVKTPTLVTDTPSGRICPKKENTAGPTVPRQIKLMPGCGQSLRGGGLNPALVMHTGLKGTNPVPAPADLIADNPVVMVLPVVPPELLEASIATGTVLPPAIPESPMESESDSAITTVSIPLIEPSPETVIDPIPTTPVQDTATASGQTTNFAPLVDLQTNILASLGQSVLPNATLAPDLGLEASHPTELAAPVDLQARTSVSLDQSVLPNATLAPDLGPAASDSTELAVPVDLQAGTSVSLDQSVLPNATLAPDLVTVPTELIAIFSNPLPEVLVNQTIPSVATSGDGASASGFATPVMPSGMLSSVVPEANVFELPAVATVQATPEVPTVSPESPETHLPLPELRRDVIETVAAMLAPFMMTLPVIPPELFPNQSAAQPGDALIGGGSAVKSLTVTVKIGSQSSFSFELPQSSLSEAGTTDILAASTAMDETGDRPAHAPTAFLLPATMTSLADADQILDFRVRLKAVVEAAWSQVEQNATEVESTTLPVQMPAFAELLPESSTIVRESVAAPLPVVAEGSQPAVSVKPSSNAILPTVVPAVQTPKSESQNASVEVMIEIPGIGSLTAEVVASDGTVLAQEKMPRIRSGRAEKSAGDLKSAEGKGSRENAGSEKTFLSTGVQSLKGKSFNAGTDVAISDDTMPARFTSRRVAVDQLEFPPRINVREIQPAFTQSQDLVAPADSPVSTTPAPVLAHRAVETILNVVEAQRQSAANASSVNLHFKFGSEDLAVRVQMRGGEVLTQFMTDSAELRSAISSEWQVMAGQGGAAGLRLHEPTIVPASAGTSSGFGSAAQGQNHGRQQAQQQQEQAASTMPELHPLRQRAMGAKPLTEVAPRVSIAPKTSQHLTATA